MDIILIDVKLSKEILVPQELGELINTIRGHLEKWNKVYVVGGRMPIWAYAAIVHLLHPSMSVAVYDPRLDSGIVVQSHITDLKIGDVIPRDSSWEVINVDF